MPFMSDQFFHLAKNLRDLSSQHANEISLPAGAVLVSVACLESYINQVAEVALSGSNRRDFDALKNNLVKKLQFLNERGRIPNQLGPDILEDVASLYGLRGRLMHYRVDPEHPIDTATSFQRLVARFPESVRTEADVSTAELLTPLLAEWAVERISKAVKDLYKSGWEPPRPRWLELVDPQRFAN